MAVSKRTLRLLQGMRVEVNETVDTATRDLVKAWSRAWSDLLPDWDAAVADLISTAGSGGWPARRAVLRAERVIKALDATRDALESLADGARVRIASDLPGVTEQAAGWHARVTASQMPPAAGTQVELVAAFNRVDPHALTAIVTRSTQQIESLTRPLTGEATAAMQRALIRGVALGQNPRAAARVMVRNLNGGFAGGLSRALVIARTEILDSHRAAGFAADQANADVLAGWVWVAGRSVRTCPACWAMSGSEHPVSEPGPSGHQSCACTRGPLTKSWKELGFDIDEPESVLPDARTAFDALSKADQLAVMGPTRLAGLNDGSISWGDLAVRKENPAWRASYVVTPLRDLVGAH